MPDDIKPIFGDEPKKRKVKGSEIQPIYFNETSAALTGTGGTSQVPFDDFRFQPKTNADNYKLRAQNQSGWDQFGNTLLGFAPKVAIGITEALGYTAELFDSSNDYTNPLIETLEDWRGRINENLPVYRENPDETFDLGDPAWWYSNIGGLTESVVEFALPIAGEAKLIGTGIKALSQAAKLGKTSSAVLRAAGALTTSAHAAYWEGAMSGKQVYQEIYDKRFKELSDSGTDPSLADEMARRSASEGAATTVRLNTLMNTAMNLAAVAPLFRNSENKITQWLMKEGQRGADEPIAAYRQRITEAATKDPALAKALKYRSGLTSHTANMFAEGFEEINTQFAEETGREQGGIRAKEGLNFIADYFDKVWNQEGALNFVLGSVGGVGQTLVLDNIPIHKIAKYDSSGKPLYKQGEDGSTVYQTKRVSSRTKDAFQREQYFSNVKDALLADIDWYSEKNRELQEATTAKNFVKANQLRQQMFNVLNLNAIMMGTADTWKQQYQEIGGLDNTKDLGDDVRTKIEQVQQAMVAATPEQKPALEQQLGVLNQQLAKVGGKTDAMLKGYARDKNDNDYKEKARQASTDLEWMGKLYRDMREAYVTDAEPHSEQLTSHIFVREVEQRMNKRLLAEEEAAISRDEDLGNSINSYNSQVEILNRTGKRLDLDRAAILKALQTNDVKAIKKFANKYHVQINDDREMPKAMKELADELGRRVERQVQDSKTIKEQLKQDSGFVEWEKSNPGKSMDDYLKSRVEEEFYDERFTARRADLAQLREEWEIAQQNLMKVKSKRGMQSFLAAALKHKKDWKRSEEAKNMRDNIIAFQRTSDKQTAAKLSTGERLKAIAQVTNAIKQNVEKSNELKAQLEELQKRYEELSKVTGAFKNRKKLAEKRQVSSQIESITAQLVQLGIQKKTLEQQLAILTEGLKEDAVKEQAAENITVEQASQPAEQTQQATAVQIEQQAAAEAVAAQQASEYETSQIPGPVQTVLDQAEAEQRGRMEKGEEFSYDLTMKYLKPAIVADMIPEEQAHDLIIKQREFLQSDVRPAVVDTTPQPVPDVQVANPEITAADLTNLPDTFVPVIDGARDPEFFKNESYNEHMGAKASVATKNGTASIEYMEKETEVEAIEDGNRITVKKWSFIPRYDRLDQKANHNVLVPGFVSEGDTLEFHVDTTFQGEINYDKMLTEDEFGAPKKRRDSFADHSTENGQVFINSETDGYANVPIKIVHQKSRQTIGYLHRTDWVMAQYGGAANYRNIEGNVPAEVETLKSIRKKIALAFNAGKGQVIQTTVLSRDSSGHPFYNMTVNVDQKTIKLAPPLTAASLIPGPVKMGIVDNKGQLNVGFQLPISDETNFTKEDLQRRYGRPDSKGVGNIPVVLLPMPNGRYSESPLFTKQLAENPVHLNTMLRAIEAYLAYGTDQFTEEHAKVIDGIQKSTEHQGTAAPLNIVNESDLEMFINQYFTYTQRFDDKHTSVNAPGNKNQRWKLAVMPKLSTEGKAQIKVGMTYSGVKPVYAALQDGKLTPEFEEAFREGIGTHYKVVTYTRGPIRGINDNRPFNSIMVQANGVVRVDRHANYNEYLKTTVSTIIYGKHKINKDGKEAGAKEPGTYVYGANPVIEFDPQQIFDTVLNLDSDTAAAAQLQVKSAEQKTEDLTEDARLKAYADLFGGGEGALNLDSNKVAVNNIGNIEDARSATLQNLVILHQNTPAEKRNGKSPELALAEMHALGITEISPRYNPFLKC
jgi:hypothetical protein